MTAHHARSSIQNIVDYMQENGLAIYTNPTVINRYAGGYRVTWRSPYPQPEGLFRNRFGSIDSYREWLNAGAYSAVLFDGSLLQLSVDYSGTQISGYRYAYIPFPVYVKDLSELVEFSIIDILESYLTENGENVRLRTPIRFDYDPDASVPIWHPVSHITINSKDCRWAVSSSIGLGCFIQFVFMHFYQRQWRRHEYIRTLVARRGPPSIHNSERQFLYVTIDKPPSRKLIGCGSFSSRRAR